MLCRVGFKPSFPLNGPLDFLPRDDPLLHDAVGYNCRDRAMEKVQDPVVDAQQAGAQFVDAILKEVCLRSPQFVTEFTEPFQPNDALVLGLRR